MHSTKALPGLLGNGKRAFIPEEQRPNFDGVGEQKTIFWNREHKKQIFDFGRVWEQANLIQGNKGTGTPPERGSVPV